MLRTRLNFQVPLRLLGASQKQIKAVVVVVSYTANLSFKCCWLLPGDGGVEFHHGMCPHYVTHDDARVGAQHRYLRHRPSHCQHGIRYGTTDACPRQTGQQTRREITRTHGEIAFLGTLPHGLGHFDAHSDG